MKQFMNTPEELSLCMGLGGCGCYISCKYNPNFVPSFVFINISHNSAPDYYLQKHFMMVHRMRISTLRRIRCTVLDMEPGKK